MASKRELLRNAKHEAGHAIFALTIDVEFRDVTIVPYLPTRPLHSIVSKEPVMGMVLGGVRFEPGTVSYANDWDWACFSMAGLAGERIERKSSGRFTTVDLFGGAYDDWHKAKKEVEKFSTPNGIDKWINKVLADAWNRLRLQKASHARLLNLLLEKGTVTYDEVLELYDLEWEALRNRTLVTNTLGGSIGSG